MNKSLVEEVSKELKTVSQRIESAPDLTQTHLYTKEKKLSALNFYHYMKFRQLDISHLQNQLGRLGLSRFARAEGHILHSLLLVQEMLDILMDKSPDMGHSAYPSPEQALHLLAENTDRLLGKRPDNRRMMIMVTLPGEAAKDPAITEKLVLNGMNCARINCAHDSPDEWLQMIHFARKAADKHKKPLKIAMDLGGPKIRTSEVSGSQQDKKGNAYIPIQQGDTILLGANKDALAGQLYHGVTLTYPSILQSIKKGERIFFDDGKIEGQIKTATNEMAEIEIVKCKPDGARLKTDKGINFPDSQLGISGLTQKDTQDFDFISGHADIVNFSFVNTVQDLNELFELIDTYNAHELGIILKIETKRAYNNLWSLLIETMKRSNPFGIMIARGDLAIEAGWENIGYVQRELLRVCTAAHLPIVWATQVLENLAKKGVPSRSELTDITQSMKAECVMLNKGPFINEALTFLDKFLVEGEAFQQKNKSMLPSLRELL